MTNEELQEENRLLRKLMIERDKHLEEILKENAKYKKMYWDHRAKMDEYEEMEYLERENKELKDEIKGYKEENTRLYNGNNRLYNDNIRLAREIKELGGN